VGNIEVSILVFAMPAGFVTYSVIQLFRQSHSPFVAPTIVAVVTAVLVVGAYLYYFSGVDDPDFIDGTGADLSGHP
jgi:predicted branched-subunit amino acid permease